MPESPATASIAWVYLDERPRRTFRRWVQPALPVYRAQVYVMAGFLEQSRIDGIAEAVASRLRVDVPA